MHKEPVSHYEILSDISSDSEQISGEYKVRAWILLLLPIITVYGFQRIDVAALDA